MDDFITLEEVRSQCYLNVGDTSEDNYITLLRDAALKRVETFTNRKLYLTESDLPEGGDDIALIWQNDVKMGVLLLIGGWYENREEMTDKQVYSLPFGFKMLVGPYKFIPV